MLTNKLTFGIRYHQPFMVRFWSKLLTDISFDICFHQPSLIQSPFFYLNHVAVQWSVSPKYSQNTPYSSSMMTKLWGSCQSSTYDQCCTSNGQLFYRSYPTLLHNFIWNQKTIHILQFSGDVIMGIQFTFANCFKNLIPFPDIISSEPRKHYFHNISGIVKDVCHSLGHCCFGMSPSAYGPNIIFVKRK